MYIRNIHLWCIQELAEFAQAGADMVLTKPMRANALELLFAHFEENGVLSKEDHKLFMDSEKLIWVPKRSRGKCAY